ncbi:MAG: hypothetical protein D6689_18990 [Deltaproteobacteria bacterium]|nr:MAG: hypothetical protein D6689_18990 [Deltaproteobacteria bacterium]
MVALICAAALPLAAACGDDGDDDDDTTRPDASQPDIDAAAPDASPPDAGTPDAGPTSTRSGSIAVTEISAPQLGGISGMAVSISFIDLSTVTVAPAFDSTNPASPLAGGCTVTVYTVGTDSEPTEVDEGPVTIENTVHPIEAPCTFVSALGYYACIEQAGAIAATDAVTDDGSLPAGTIPANTALVTIAGATFDENDVGRYIQIAGFPTAANNGSFPIVALGQAATQVVIANPAAVSEAAGGDGSFSVISGAGPTPANRDALDDGTTPIKVSLGGNTGDVDDFSVMVQALGEGFQLDDETAGNLTAMPTDGSAVSFSCSGTNGDCGADTGVVKVMVISGKTTDADVTGLPPNTMPAPTTKYARFRCSSPSGAANSVTIPAEAMAAILGTNPTRIETRVFRMGGTIAGNADMTNATTVVAGHGHVGWTTVSSAP